MSKNGEVVLTREEAITTLRIARAGGWSLQKELDVSSSRNQFFKDSGRLIEKLEKFLDK